VVGRVERDAPDGSVYVIDDYRCAPAPGADVAGVVAGDDADVVGWFTPDEVRALDCVPGLVDVLEEWGVLR
jgi:8-oxo-dGTP diphosphatase